MNELEQLRERCDKLAQELAAERRELQQLRMRDNAQRARIVELEKAILAGSPMKLDLTSLGRLQLELKLKAIHDALVLP